MAVLEEGFLVQCGRVVTTEELEEICATVEPLGGLSRQEVVQTVCEHLDWRTASGSPKVTACRKLLEKLEAAGRLQLPAKRRYRPRAGGLGTGGSVGDGSAPVPLWEGTLRRLGPVGLEVVSGRERKALWNEYVDRYHYLGSRRAFGYRLRYFVTSDRGLLGCVLLAGAAKALSVRDAWIGWTPRQRLSNLAWVVNNTRFLIFPWVRVPHLASHVLGRLARQVRRDWLERWGYEPVLLESFVDAQRYRGTCYRAAGWEELGLTQGQGLVRPGRRYTTTPKRLFVRPLVEDFRSRLCSERLVGQGEP